MNFLSLCQRAQQYSGLQGTTISTVTGIDSNDFNQRIVDAVNQAYYDIQTYRADFKFLQGSENIMIRPGVEEYHPEDVLYDDDIAAWKTNAFIFEDRRIPYIPYDRWLVNATSELSFSVKPEDNTLLFGGVEEDTLILAHYFKNPDELTSDTDIPILPTKHHLLIVYGAVVHLSAMTGNLISHDKYSLLYNQGLGQLFRDNIPAKRARYRHFA